MYQHPGNRPVNLDLKAFRFPLNAYLSILHRITGVMLIIGLIVGLVWLNQLILQPDQFAERVRDFEGVLGQLFLFGLLASLWYHWLAGLRHLLIEHNFFGMLESLEKATASARMLIGAFIAGLIVLAAGMWL